MPPEPAEDAKDGRAAQRDDWAARADAWDRSSPQEIDATDVYDSRLIAAAGIKPGLRVVDLGSGTGQPALAIARTVGPGLVFATDLVPAMLAAARRRAAEAGLANIRFTVADMHHLPYADGAFDALTCRFGLMFPDDVAAAVAEMRRVLKRQARAAFLVWGPVEANELYDVTRRAMRTFLGLDPSTPPGKRHRFADAGSLTAALAAGGLDDVTEEEVLGESTFASDMPFWRSRLERTYPKETAALGEGDWSALDARVVDAIAPFRHGTDYRFRTFARLGVGRAP